MADKPTKTPVPPHKAQPLLIPSDEPIEALETAHGLVALIYGPAKGVCTSCRKRSDRITQNGRHCPSCAAQQAA